VKDQLRLRVGSGVVEYWNVGVIGNSKFQASVLYNLGAQRQVERWSNGAIGRGRRGVMKC
jgi:hypothetical protein